MVLPSFGVIGRGSHLQCGAAGERRRIIERSTIAMQAQNLEHFANECDGKMFATHHCVFATETLREARNGGAPTSWRRRFNPVVRGRNNLYS
jgi:hypothetical protein